MEIEDRSVFLPTRRSPCFSVLIAIICRSVRVLRPALGDPRDFFRTCDDTHPIWRHRYVRNSRNSHRHRRPSSTSVLRPIPVCRRVGRHVIGTGSKLDAASITLLILYPAFDVAAAVFDARTSGSPALYTNMAISTAAAIGLAFAAADDIPAVLRVWGTWAIFAGLVQMLLALKRRGLGGQWAMILSGSLSVIAGGVFLGQASGTTSMKVVGYAGVGGLFFLISAVRLLRQSNTTKLNRTR